MESGGLFTLLGKGVKKGVHLGSELDWSRGSCTEISQTHTFFKSQGVCFLIDVCHNSRKFCVVVDNQSEDEVVFQTFPTVRVVLIT